MKPFAQWVGDMANSIEDASTIAKDADGNVVITVPVEESTKDTYLDVDGNVIPALSQEELYEHWHQRFNEDYYD